MQISPRVPALVLLFVACCAQADISLSAPGKAAKEAELGPPPLEPVPANVRVKRGGKVEVPLRVFGIPNQPVIYRLRVLPGWGKVSEPRMVGRGVGMVTYQHSGEKDEESDQFLYAVQTAKGVSVSVKVNITIVDDPPTLSAPQDVDLGTVMIGSTARREITIENRGGGNMKGTITIDEPWKIDGKDSYSLRSGERQTFGLVIAPQVEQTFNGVIRYSSHPRQTTSLRVMAEAAISVTPKTLELTSVRDTIRAGVLKIVNRTGEEQPLRLHGGAHLSVPERVSVPPKGEVSVPIETLPGQLAQMTDEVQIDSASFATRVSVRAPAVGPIIRGDLDLLSFGKIDAGSVATATLRLTNVGGTQGRVQVTVVAPFVIATADSTFSLNAGASKEVKVSARFEDAGKIDSALLVKTSSTRWDIPIEVEVVGKPVVAQAAPKRGAKISLEPETPPPVRPPLDQARITRLTSTTCELAWRGTMKGQPRYEIERMVGGRDGIDWILMPNVDITSNGSNASIGKNMAMHGVSEPDAEIPDPSEAGGLVTARIKGLMANTAYRLRVVVIDPKDDTNRPSVPLEFQTTGMWTQANALRFGVPSAILLLGIVIIRRSNAKTSPVEPRAEPTEKAKAIGAFVPPPSRGEPSAASPKPRNFPAIRELEPGVFYLDVD